MLLSLAALDAFGQQRIEVRSAYVEASDSVYLLSTTIDFDLPEGARAAVREGVPLTLDLEIVVQRSRRFWRDETIAALVQRYELVFHALSSRYVVRNLNSGEQSSYATLDAALDSMRVIQDLPILDRALIETPGRYEFGLRASLDVRTMPDALRFVLFWKDDWRQRSEWYTWSPRL
ncbi:MAG TPA: DUF4390 domain-containing protein [Steroidobacteraceae bacterium]